MRVTVGGMLFALIAGATLAQGDLNGREIIVETGSQPSLNTPVSLPYEGVVAEGDVVRVRAAKSDKALPATARDGELVFVSEGMRPKSTHSFTVEVVKDNAPPTVTITKRDGEEALDVVIDGVPFTTYHYSNDNKKPFLWPVLGDGGVHVTRDYPMGPKEQSGDHPHHKSMWTAYGDINGADCWGEGDNSGYQVSGDVTCGSGDAYGWIHAKNVWENHEHQPVIDEEREYRFYASSPKARILDETVTFTASYGDALFGDTKEGGIMTVRMRDQMIEKNGGTITNSRGQHGMEEAWGQPAEWCDYSGTIDKDGIFGISIFDNPANLRYPTRWHVRDYGLMGANCFGLSYFTKGKGDLNGDYTLKKGETLTFKYRAYVHSDDVKKAKVAERYADYIAPPTARWSEAPSTPK